MGDVNEETTTIEPGAAGAPEGAVGAEPSADEIAELYKATGVKAPVPTGKPKGRPKTADLRAKKSEEDGAGDSDSKREEAKNDNDKDKSKNAPDSNSDDASGNKVDSKKSKNGSDDEQLQDESGDADKGVRDPKSKGEGDSERGREEDSDGGTGGTGQKTHDESDSEEATGDDEKGVKRPGKSNPEVEKRMQQLANERKEALERAEKAEQKLKETTRKQEQARISQEDPEYTVEDFRTVRDNATGEIRELTAEQAELAWHRWKDGYNSRAAEREAKLNHEKAREEHEAELTRKLMKDSADAYDALAALQDEYPELVSTSGKFDKDFANEAMPIIEEALEYLPGTEPGNEEGKLPVIIGFKLNPKKILNALKNINTKKRSLPLNGVNDNVESGSNVNVPHSRSSDPTVNAANDLMKELKIDKRF